MDMDFANEFINNVLHRVYYRPARKRVREELTEHIEDLMEDCLEHHMSIEEAQKESLAMMGDAKELGKEFNQVHNPVLGYCELITRCVAIICIPILILFLVELIDMGSRQVNGKEPRNRIEGEIISEQPLKEYLTLEDGTYRITSMVYDSLGNLYLFYHKASLDLNGLSFQQFNHCAFYDEKGERIGDEVEERVEYDQKVIVFYNVDVSMSELTVRYDGYQVKDSVTIEFPDNFFTGGSKG